MVPADFHAMRAEPVDTDDAADTCREIEAALEAAETPAERRAALDGWNRLRARIDTWGALVHLHFNQDTRDDRARRARDAFDEAEPGLVELKVEVMRRLLKSPHRPELEASLGSQAFALWESEITTFDPVIADDMVAEARLRAEYTQLLASAEFAYDGETLNLSTIRKFAEHPDRSVRRETDAMVWGWFQENGQALDRIFGDLVGLRTSMAKKLGFDDFVDLGYRRMSRVDYGRADVERYRDSVREQVVPLCSRLRERQAETLGVAKLRFFDEAVHDPRGNPAPKGDHDWMVERAQAMFDAMGGGLDDFFRLMTGRHLFDLKARPGKAGGGFCTSLTTHKVPFIYANFNGTKSDVEVFTHEMGHAFQCYMSRNQFPVDYLWPTAEACEIHSMGLEYLTWPHMEKFFGDEAERFRRIHLTSSLLFLPYGVAIDHFQHRVYENPEATPEERHAMWKEMEALYLPWRDYDGVARGEAGALWQRQLHVYQFPFYYIDYTLAEVCALQFWARASKDREAAMKAYRELCARGGEAPFQELVRGAGLVSPFDEGCLASVVDRARETLGL